MNIPYKVMYEIFWEREFDKRILKKRFSKNGKKDCNFYQSVV